MKKSNLWSWTSLIMVFPVLKPDFQTLFTNVQTKKGLISAMCSNGPLTPSNDFRFIIKAVHYSC